MARAKKNGKFVNIYMQADLFTDLETYCARTGLSKTVAIESLLRKGIDQYCKENGNTPLHSGFEAPVIGTTLPRGTTYINNPDGTITLVFPEEEGK